ncbi:MULTISPECIES: Tn3 family transposase post-transcriptional regulator TnpC [unclassified Burkholderia]|uniref:Tn3 family transposase post-transcriptional regulator TnpC n=1 Tax=unclassified Burkholderia TaxID=2613784 RepID=UPI00075A3EFD|nr:MULTISPECIES: Tn3 family transposase post-transcriptional regulator TnpC [unclassified Burkholderia]KUY56313.1 transposase [Burkholderia sp. RF2-non_BP3]KUY70948.1 transposase [Burkholderia sp. RF4-BP95]KUZ03836.1 transposase [Burkholderia sp. RF7-non_BP1]KUZ05039.1 transposase [Burkholderia sp. RF7-non_BP4]
MTARPATTTTFFGGVDTAALARLESSYDTTRLLATVDIVDRIRTQLYDPEGLRDDLLEIHSMTHSVLNGASIAPSRRRGALPERVLEALDLIDEFVDELTRVRTILEPLDALQPDEDFGED